MAQWIKPRKQENQSSDPQDPCKSWVQQSTSVTLVLEDPETGIRELIYGFGHLPGVLGSLFQEQGGLSTELSLAH